MAAPEGFTVVGQGMSAEQVEASKAVAMQRALKEYGFVLTLVETFAYTVSDEGDFCVGSAYEPLRDQQEASAIEAADSYWGLRNRRNLCDEEYVGPPDIM